MALAAIGDIFTPAEIDLARDLYAKAPAGTFAARCAAEIVAPALPRINARLGQENDARYLAYALELALSQAPSPR